MCDVSEIVYTVADIRAAGNSIFLISLSLTAILIVAACMNAMFRQPWLLLTLAAVIASVCTSVIYDDADRVVSGAQENLATGKWIATVTGTVTRIEPASVSRRSSRPAYIWVDGQRYVVFEGDTDMARGCMTSCFVRKGQTVRLSISKTRHHTPTLYQVEVCEISSR